MDKPFIDSSDACTERRITHTASAPSLRDDINCHSDDATKEAQELFGRTIGKCYASFSCSHSRIRGRLYVSSRALLFYSSLLGFETRISLDFHDVLEIELFRTTSISVRTFEGETYVFKSFEDRNAALYVLETHVQLTSSTTLDTNSIASSVTNAFSPLLGKQRHRNPLQYNLDSQIKVAPMVGNRRRCVSDSIVNGQDVVGSLEATRVSLPQSELLFHSEETGDIPKNLFQETKETETWESLHIRTPLQEVAVKSLDLPCSLEFFFQTFFADDAEHSLTRYQSERIQDRDVRASPWKIQEMDEKEGVTIMTRTIIFTHPIKAVAMGLGPTEAMTKRHQRFRRFDKGILLENTTHIEGIPNADTFCICDRWVIAENNSTCLILSSSFELQFTKRSFFRSLIEKSVKRETFEWWSGYTQMLKEVLQKAEAPSQTAISSDTELLKVSSQILERLDRYYKWTNRMLCFGIVVLVCFFLLLVALVTAFTSEIKLLRDALQTSKLMVPECVVNKL